MAKKNATTTVEMREIKLTTVKMRLVGDSPLIIHNFSKKAQGIMLAKQVGVTWPKEAKNPRRDYEAATYYINKDGTEIPCPAKLEWIADGQINLFMEEWGKHMDALGTLKNPIFGLPAVAFKACAIRGAKSVGLVMADMRGAFHIPVEYVKVDGDREMRSDMVRISHSTSDVRFRPVWQDWSATFDVVYNATVVTLDMLFNMFKVGGFSCGLGEWRPEKGGDFGRYHVES